MSRKQKQETNKEKNPEIQLQNDDTVELNNSELSIKEKDKGMIIKQSESDSLADKQDKYYIPVCREKGCEGYLKFYFIEENYLIDCECVKNKNHKSDNLYYETFERFYLKENFIKKCSNCKNILENIDKYECIECNKLYCSSCFLSDQHIRKDWKNLQITSNKCPKDKNELTYYCLDCDEKVCRFCLKKYTDQEKNHHKNHKIKNILDKIPSLYQINCLKEKILKKEKAYDILFKTLDEWQTELNKNIEKIKQNMRTEIRILKKLFYNFNQDYVNYHYYSDFFDFLTDIKDYNNKYLNDFMKSTNFQVKTGCIFNLLFKNNEKPKDIKTNLESLFEIGRYGILEYFTDKFLLFYSEKKEENTIELLSLKNMDKVCKIKLTEKIKSFSFSPDTKKIYACLKNKKSVLIINYNSDNNILKLSDEIIEIEDDLEENFNKCIPMNDNDIITIDSNSIYLWKKIVNSNNFLNTQKKDLFCNDINDLCKINDKYLVFTHHKKLTFYSIENLKVEKNIEYIDCIKKEKSLILIKDYILVNCSKGIAIISIRTKEIVQYIQNLEYFSTKKIYKSNDDYIYISNSLNDIYKFSFVEYNLKLIEKIKVNDDHGELGKHSYHYYDDSYSDNVFIYNNGEGIDLNEYNVIICNNIIFILDKWLYYISEE